MGERSFVVSVHDVMPETLDRCERIVERLAASSLNVITLFVVPGRNWSAAQLDRLRTLSADGIELAGHGWRHEARHIRGLKHRLHSALISRNVAEHLALDADGIEDLIRRCHAWFGEHDLDVGELYVPPAWAMGTIGRRRLANQPFRLFETLGGVLDAGSGRYSRTPMIGFEADNALRAVGCSLWNGFNLMTANARPIRLGIHPCDFELKLSDSLERVIERGGRAVSYSVWRFD
jgi:predicted deacetylase